MAQFEGECCMCFCPVPKEEAVKPRCNHIYHRSCFINQYVDNIRNEIDPVCSGTSNGSSDGTACTEIFTLDWLKQISFSKDDKKEICKELNLIYKKRNKLKTCPSCQTWLNRTDKSLKIYCRKCTKYLCWACERKWQDNKNSQICGNNNCDGLDPIQKLIADCGTRQLSKIFSDVFEYRCCPACDALIHHTGVRCKHVLACPKCSYAFCFICLKGKKDQLWQCKPLEPCDKNAAKLGLVGRQYVRQGNTLVKVANPPLVT